MTVKIIVTMETTRLADTDLLTSSTNIEDKNKYVPNVRFECSVCLQTCVHPVRLPCTHIFCFLCVKGAANRSKRCALCRQEIPHDYFNNPTLLESLNVDDVQFDDGYQWFYEGRSGWWQYDERTAADLEENFKRREKTVEMLVAGFLYVIDFENMVQYRRNDPTRRRRVKRDLVASTARKGVAGLKMEREGTLCGSETTDGGDGGSVSDTRDTHTIVTQSDAVVASGQPNDVLNNTPQTSMNNSSIESSPQSGRHGDVEELTTLVEAVNFVDDSTHDSNIQVLSDTQIEDIDVG